MLQKVPPTAGELAPSTATSEPFRTGVTSVPLHLRAAFILQHTLVLCYDVETSGPVSVKSLRVGYQASAFQHW